MGRVRLGLVLEDIDSFAADVAARHMAGLEGFGVITAAMDRLTLVTHEQHVQQVRQGLLSSGGGNGSSGVVQAAGSGGGNGVDATALRPPLDAAGRQELQRAIVEAPAGSEAASGGPLLIDNDLRLAGCVAWVGRSSLEVVIELADRPAPADGSASPTDDADGRGWRRRGVAHFVMVMKSTRPGVPLRLYPLDPATPQEEELCRQAAARQEERRVRRAADAAKEGGPLSVAGPDAALLQALVSRASQQRAEEWRHHLSSSGAGAASALRAAVPVGATLLRAPVIMHHQDRNITDAVFGGHVRALWGWLLRGCGGAVAAHVP
jgi:acyl-CoA hydrolase